MYKDLKIIFWKSSMKKDVVEFAIQVTNESNLIQEIPHETHNSSYSIHQKE